MSSISRFRVGQPGQLLAGGNDLLGIDPYRLHRCADGQRFALTVEDHAAVGRHFHHAQMAGITLALEKITIQHLQIHGTPYQRREGAGHHHQQQPAATMKFSAGGCATHGRTITT
jgi:hypothetical protein